MPSGLIRMLIVSLELLLRLGDIYTFSGVTHQEKLDFSLRSSSPNQITIKLFFLLSDWIVLWIILLFYFFLLSSHLLSFPTYTLTHRRLSPFFFAVQDDVSVYVRRSFFSSRPLGLWFIFDQRDLWIIPVRNSPDSFCVPLVSRGLNTAALSVRSRPPARDWKWEMLICRGKCVLTLRWR